MLGLYCLKTAQDYLLSSFLFVKILSLRAGGNRQRGRVQPIWECEIATEVRISNCGWVQNIITGRFGPVLNPVDQIDKACHKLFSREPILDNILCSALE